MAITKSVPTGQASTILLSGQQAISKQLEVASYNLSNISTPAFKGLMVETKSIDYQTRPDSQPLTYTQTTPVQRNFTRGTFVHTRNDFDLGITQKGFFMLANNKLTRNGRFMQDVNGTLRTYQGETVLDTGGSEINIPLNAKKVLISPDGTISTEKGNVAKIAVFRVPDEHKLKGIGNGQFIAAEGEPPTLVASPDVVQGVYEDSNIELIGEFIRVSQMQEVFKGYQDVAIQDEERRKQLIRLSPKP